MAIANQKERFTLRALILAGGRGTRLRPLTDIRPKPLLYLPGGTVLDYLLADVRALSIDEIGIVVNYNADKIAAHVDGAAGVTLIQQQPPFTLLGALASASEWVQDATLVIHADNYFSQSLQPAVFAADRHTSTFFTDTPDEPNQARRLANTGAYILSQAAFEIAEELADADELVALTNELIARNHPVEATPLPGWRCNINEPADLLTVNRFLLSSWPEVAHPMTANAGYDPMALSWTAPDAHVNGHTHMGLYVTVGAGATIHNSTLHNVLVFPGVEINNFEEENVILAETERSLLRVYVPNGTMELPRAS